MDPQYFEFLFGLKAEYDRFEETMIYIVCDQELFHSIFELEMLERVIRIMNYQLENEIETKIMKMLEPITELKTTDQIVERIRFKINDAQEFKKPWTKCEDHLAAIKFIEKFVPLFLNPLPFLSNEDKKIRGNIVNLRLTYLQNELKKSGWLACTQNSEQVTVLHLK